MENIKKLCQSCDCTCFKIKENGVAHEIKDILPENICLLQFHSVYAYILTLANGGWFNWVGHEQHVIVNCPSTEGIAVHLKGNESEIAKTMEIEVIKNVNCPRRYEKGQVFKFDISAENMLLMSMIEKAFPDILIFSEKNKCDSKVYSHEFNKRQLSFEMESTRIKDNKI